ncbi:hypothetical protein OKW21_000220 [Catalinimonas alkaloidigena]|uniref:outer membrane beta-barrel protein n=1 Tax=Catalinimonas alkaloidigena TaxID=1075417 RepID=UPI002406863B|nr:outer membrane beta-barrel protein [Catalinimonas alkaloidigena]MDF9794957.1 hypothetical protein [Catalinimonas alkaloidigena]
MKKVGVFFFLYLLNSQFLVAQEAADSTQSLTLSAHSDVYFANFSGESEANSLQPVTTVSPRDERFGLNIAQLGVHYNADRVRGNVIIHYGDIAEATWSEEFRAVQEANMGVRLFDKWWVDAGFFATHIGTESFLPKNNYTSATAVATYNEPFFQSGARLSYEGSERLDFAFWVVSGYNYFLDANDAKSVGIATSYALSDNLNLTYTNLFGRESLDGQEPEQYRTYHNLYANWQPADSWFVIIGGDLGTQTNSELENPNGTAFMYNALTTVRWQFSPLYSITARGEIFQDPEGFISGIYTTFDDSIAGLELYGLTLSTEYRPLENAYVRLEGRYLETLNEITIFDNADMTTHRWEMMITMGWEIEKAWAW